MNDGNSLLGIVIIYWVFYEHCVVKKTDGVSVYTFILKLVHKPEHKA